MKPTEAHLQISSPRTRVISAETFENSRRRNKTGMRDMDPNI